MNFPFEKWVILLYKFTNFAVSFVGIKVSLPGIKFPFYPKSA